MIRNVLLDWSGTVVNDFEAVFKATNTVLVRFGRPEILRDTFRRDFVLPYAKFYERFLPNVPLQEIDTVFHNNFDQFRDQVELQDGAREFLDFCRSSGRKLFVLSTIKASHFQAQLTRLRLQSAFDRVYVEVRDKTSMIEAIVQENHLNPCQTLFAGDMLHDIEAGRIGKVLPVAVLNGFDSAEKLANALPDLTVRDLSILQKVMEWDGKVGEDWIELADQEVYCRIGVPPEERLKPQRLLVSVRFQIHLPFGQLDDKFEKTIDYSAVADEVDRAATEQETLLVEAFVDKVSNRLMQRFPMRRVQVAAKKFILPNTKYIEVRTERVR